MWVVAILTPKPEAWDLFREYETKAAAILARYGARIVQSIVDEPRTREVHLIAFPSREAFQHYRADVELASLATLREASITHTEVIIGHDGPTYGGAGTSLTQP
ncbi:MAG: DUF1330 domain-containing protein [Bryobacterales bacterium]|nr:DUF1330 domain-containing protein [Bryobacterales bacterium]